MNAAFRRGEAITRLENYAPVIVEHLCLLTWFPSHHASSHWKTELNAWIKALKRYNTGKGKSPNFTSDLIIKSLQEIIETGELKDYMLINVEAHGVSVEDGPNWAELEQAFKEFAIRII